MRLVLSKKKKLNVDDDGQLAKNKIISMLTRSVKLDHPNRKLSNAMLRCSAVWAELRGSGSLS